MYFKQLLCSIKSSPLYSKVLTLSLILCLGLLTTACSDGLDIENKYPDKRRDRIEKYGSLSGGDGFTILGNSKKKTNNADGSTGLGVNSYLWRATLDTVSFMPIASADPFGGVIITDWYSPPNAPEERFKVNAFIMDRQLRADGVKVTIFRQVHNKNRGWEDSQVAANANTDLENAILTRAREIKIKQGEGLKE